MPLTEAGRRALQVLRQGHLTFDRKTVTRDFFDPDGPGGGGKPQHPAHQATLKAHAATKRALASDKDEDHLSAAKAHKVAQGLHQKHKTGPFEKGDSVQTDHAKAAGFHKAIGNGEYLHAGDSREDYAKGAVKYSQKALDRSSAAYGGGTADHRRPTKDTGSQALYHQSMSDYHHEAEAHHAALANGDGRTRVEINHFSAANAHGNAAHLHENALELAERPRISNAPYAIVARQAEKATQAADHYSDVAHGLAGDEPVTRARTGDRRRVTRDTDADETMTASEHLTRARYHQQMADAHIHHYQKSLNDPQGPNNHHENAWYHHDYAARLHRDTAEYMTNGLSKLHVEYGKAARNQSKLAAAASKEATKEEDRRAEEVRQAVQEKEIPTKSQRQAGSRHTIEYQRHQKMAQKHAGQAQFSKSHARAAGAHDYAAKEHLRAVKARDPDISRDAYDLGKQADHMSKKLGVTTDRRRVTRDGRDPDAYHAEMERYHTHLADQHSEVHELGGSALHHGADIKHQNAVDAHREARAVFKGKGSGYADAAKRAEDATSEADHATARANRLTDDSSPNSVDHQAHAERHAHKASDHADAAEDPTQPAWIRAKHVQLAIAHGAARWAHLRAAKNPGSQTLSQNAVHTGRVADQMFPSLQMTKDLKGVPEEPGQRYAVHRVKKNGVPEAKHLGEDRSGNVGSFYSNLTKIDAHARKGYYESLNKGSRAMVLPYTKDRSRFRDAAPGCPLSSAVGLFMEGATPAQALARGFYNQKHNDFERHDDAGKSGARNGQDVTTQDRLRGRTRDRRRRTRDWFTEDPPSGKVSQDASGPTIDKNDVHGIGYHHHMAEAKYARGKGNDALAKQHSDIARFHEGQHLGVGEGELSKQQLQLGLKSAYGEHALASRFRASQPAQRMAKLINYYHKKLKGTSDADYYKGPHLNQMFEAKGNPGVSVGQSHGSLPITGVPAVRVIQHNKRASTHASHAKILKANGRTKLAAMHEQASELNARAAKAYKDGQLKEAAGYARAANEHESRNRLLVLDADFTGLSDPADEFPHDAHAIAHHAAGTIGTGLHALATAALTSSKGAAREVAQGVADRRTIDASPAEHMAEAKRHADMSYKHWHQASRGSNTTGPHGTSRAHLRASDLHTEARQEHMQAAKSGDVRDSQWAYMMGRQADDRSKKLGMTTDAAPSYHTSMMAKHKRLGELHRSKSGPLPGGGYGNEQQARESAAHASAASRHMNAFAYHADAKNTLKRFGDGDRYQKAAAHAENATKEANSYSKNMGVTTDAWLKSLSPNHLRLRRQRAKGLRFGLGPYAERLSERTKDAAPAGKWDRAVDLHQSFHAHHRQAASYHQGGSSPEHEAAVSAHLYAQNRHNKAMGAAVDQRSDYMGLRKKADEATNAAYVASRKANATMDSLETVRKRARGLRFGEGTYRERLSERTKDAEVVSFPTHLARPSRSPEQHEMLARGHLGYAARHEGAASVGEDSPRRQQAHLRAADYHQTAARAHQRATQSAGTSAYKALAQRADDATRSAGDATHHALNVAPIDHHGLMHDSLETVRKRAKRHSGYRDAKTVDRRRHTRDLTDLRRSLAQKLAPTKVGVSRAKEIV